jgi:hypothetical protein
MTDDIILDGRESALTTAALFMAALWEFENPAARAALPDDIDAGIRPVYERVSARWRQRLHDAGLWHQRPAPWTRALMVERGQLRDGLLLSPDEARTVVLALRAAGLEFATRWWEFSTASPGPIEWYDLTRDDLTALADRLERALG